MRRRALQLWLALLGVLSAAPAHAFVPSAEKVATAIAEANARAHRNRPLELAVVLRDALGDEVARGVARLRPGAGGGLELRLPDGTTERRRLVGARELVSRDGQERVAERPLLAPLALIQADSADALRDLLTSLGGMPDRVELGLEGPHDCYVLGGRRHREAEKAAAPPPVAVWVDLESFEPVRLDRGDGVRFRLGGLEQHGDVRFPATIETQAPSRPPWRLEVTSVRSVPPPAAGREGRGPGGR